MRCTVEFNKVSGKYDVTKGAELIASFNSFVMALARAQHENGV